MAKMIPMRSGYFCPRDNQKLQPTVAEIRETHNLLYPAALDDRVRLPDENPSIGMILCRTKKRAVVEYALRESNKPIGVAAYRIVRRLPAELKGKLPEPAQIQRLLEAVELPNRTRCSNGGEGA